MKYIFKSLFLVFILLFSSIIFAVQTYIQAPFPGGVIMLNTLTGSITQCQANFGAAVPTTTCKQIGFTPKTSLAGNAEIIVVGGSTNSNVVISNLATGEVTQCSLLYMGTGSCKTNAAI